jgi:hypothetical protein
LWAVNTVGNVATVEALKKFDANGEPIVVVGTKWYSRGRLPKIYNTPYGVVSAERHVYHPAEGGKTFCPMDGFRGRHGCGDYRLDDQGNTGYRFGG